MKRILETVDMFYGKRVIYVFFKKRFSFGENFYEFVPRRKKTLLIWGDFGAFGRHPRGRCLLPFRFSREEIERMSEEEIEDLINRGYRTGREGRR